MTVAHEHDDPLRQLIAREVAEPELYEHLPVPSKRSALEWPEWVARRYAPGLPACAVAYRLASYWNEQTGDAWPSYPLLAADLSCTERTVAAAVAKLEKLGVILVERHPRRTNRYTLLRAAPVLGMQELPLRDAGASTLTGRSFHRGMKERGVDPVVTRQSSKRDPAGSAGTATPPAPAATCSRHLLPLASNGDCRGCRADELAGDRA